MGVCCLMSMQIFVQQRQKGGCSNKDLLDRHRNGVSRVLHDTFIRECTKIEWFRGIELHCTSQACFHSTMGGGNPSASQLGQLAYISQVSLSNP